MRDNHNDTERLQPQIHQNRLFPPQVKLKYVPIHGNYLYIRTIFILFRQSCAPPNNVILMDEIVSTFSRVNVKFCTKGCCKHFMSLGVLPSMVAGF